MLRDQPNSIYETELAKIEQVVSKTNSIRGALFALKNNIGLFGGCHLAFEQMVQKNSYLRGDLITMTTLPGEFTDLYYPSGGTNNDPVIENIGNLKGLIKVDLREVLSAPNSKYHANPFFGAMLERGWVSLASYSMTEFLQIGHAALTVFEDETQSRRNLDTFNMIEVANHFKNCLRKHGQIKRYFGLSEAERNVLQRSGEGRTAEDLAVEFNVSRRAIELRLQNARKKLTARTTTEAVYKAIAYGILPVS